MARNRIIYGSQSVWCNGEVLFRVQTLGSTTTFSSEDIFELGRLDIVDTVDDVPSVAVTINTNDFGDVKTMAVLAQIPSAKLAMEATANGTNSNLVVVSGTNLVETTTYLHGACLADFAIVCGNLPGVSIWAPVQSECDLGTLAENIDQTLFMDEVFINSLEFSYTTGANATENYGGETDNKMWLLNDARFVNWEEAVGGTPGVDEKGFTGGLGHYITLGATATTLSDLNPGFLRKDTSGYRAVTVYDYSEGEMTNTRVSAGTSSGTGYFRFDANTDRLYSPSDLVLADDDRVYILYAADAFTDNTTSTYFSSLTNDYRPSDIGAVRQGQVEIYIVSDSDTSFEHAWRLTGCTISADLTREPLAELGHLSPYDRPLTLPIPITVSIDTTAGDLENWAKFADQYTAFDDETLDDIDLADLIASEDLKLVVKVFAQTDEEAGGTGSNRKVLTGSDLLGDNYFVDGVLNNGGTVYQTNDREYALKTIIVEHLKMTDEAYNLDMGGNATQTFNFRSTNDLYCIKGDLSVGHVTLGYKVRRKS